MLKKAVTSWVFMTLILVFGLWSCTSKEDTNVFKLGFIPFESAEDLLKNVQPLIDIIEKGLDMEVQPFISSDYTGIIESFKNGNLDAAFMSPASYIFGHQEAGIQVILKSHRYHNPFYYGVIMTHADSSIKTLQDLKNKSFSFGDPLSTSGHVFPRMLLLNAGINPDTDFKNVLYSGSHDATILAVLNKKVDAGATFSNDAEGKATAWHQFLSPEEQKQIRILAISDPIPSDNICVSKDLPKKKVDQLKKSLLDFSNSTEGQQLMRRLYHFDGYMEATHEDYEPVRKAFEAAKIPLKETFKKK